MPRHPSCARIRLAGESKPPPSRYVATLLPRTMQLSKIDPARRRGNSELRRKDTRGLVGVPGIEPGTSSLSGTRSNQLSYTPAFYLAPPPLDLAWWRQPGSNRRHPACKAGALPTELCPRGTSLSTRAQAPLSTAARGPEGIREDFQLAPAGLMWEASPLSPPRGAFHHRPASPPGCSLERR